MKIILLGYMASGKSVIGKLLAQKLALPFVDLDFLIENQEGKSINSIFENHGEIYFRKLEHQVLGKLMASPDPFVLALGGGTPCYAGNDQWLNGESIVSFYLQTPLEILLQRLESDKNSRPLIAGKSAEELRDFIAPHLFERSYYYRKATYTIATANQSPDEIINAIQSRLI